MPSVTNTDVQYGGVLELENKLLVGGFRVWKRHGAIRPGKYVPDSTIITLGKAIVAGQPLCATAQRLDINRKTAYRWVKRLNLRHANTQKADKLSPANSVSQTPKTGHPLWSLYHLAPQWKQASLF